MANIKKLVVLLVACALTFSTFFGISTLAEEVNEEDVVDTDLGKAELNDLCDLIIKAVVKDDMDDVQKAYAVYKWVEKNVKYNSKPDFETWQDAAYDAMTTYGADCYGFCASTKALLQRMGFPTVDVLATDGSHCWTMVKINGYWWHVDNTPGYGSERFMLTSQEIMDFEYINPEKYPDGLRYHFNPDDYPKTEGKDEDRVLKTEEKK